MVRLQFASIILFQLVWGTIGFTQDTRCQDGCYGFTRTSFGRDSIGQRRKLRATPLPPTNCKPTEKRNRPLFSQSEECDIESAILREELRSRDAEYDILVDEMAESLDLSRESFRLQSVSAYVVVSILTATSSFTTIQNFGVLNGDNLSAMLLHYAVLVSACAGSLTGIYATVVFSLCSIYGSTALGMRRDERYEGFMQDSLEFRIKGFNAFLTSLSMFMLQLVLVATERMESHLQLPFFMTFSAAAFYYWQDYQLIVGKASAIFAPVDNLPQKERSSVTEASYKWKKNRLVLVGEEEE